MSAKTYIVPHDFSSVADSAAFHALKMARQTGASIVLLHIVKNKNAIPSASENFKAAIKRLNLKVGDPKVKATVKIGNIFEDIAKTAIENNSRLIIMGTHGAKGMQRVFGSFALKVITSCTVPFMIVQENVKPNNITKIVAPINLSKESLQIIGAVSNLAMAFDAEIHVLGTKFTDQIQKSKMKNRIQVVRNEFTMKKVRSTFKLMDSSKSFTNHVLDYSNEIDADVIAIAHYSEKIIAQLDNFTQNIITNKKQTPVLIIKGIEATVGSF